MNGGTGGGSKSMQEKKKNKAHYVQICLCVCPTCPRTNIGTVNVRRGGELLGGYSKQISSRRSTAGFWHVVRTSITTSGHQPFSFRFCSARSFSPKGITSMQFTERFLVTIYTTSIYLEFNGERLSLTATSTYLSFDTSYHVFVLMRCVCCII